MRFTNSVVISEGQRGPKILSSAKKRFAKLLIDKPQFESILNRGEIPDRLYEWLVEKRFNQSLENVFLYAIEPLLKAKVVADFALLKRDKVKEIQVRAIEKGGTCEFFAVPVSSLVDLSSLRAMLKKRTMAIKSSMKWIESRRSDS